jgi:Ca-activated chloride channel family protein
VSKPKSWKATAPARIYNGIVAKLRDPALLEFVDRNTVRARIFPIAPRGEQKMEIEYSQPLSSDDGASRYTLPMRLPLGGAAQNSSVEVRIRNADARAAYSPTHTISNKLVNGAMQLSGEWKGGEAARDFVLYVSSSKSRIGLNIVTQQAPGEDPYFMLLAAPDPAVSAKEIAAKDVVFTFDTSGSMSGEKIEQARKALLNLLGNLNPNDRFNIVTFSSDVNPFRDSLVEANTRNVEAARQFAQGIKAVGGTNIDEALKTSLRMLRNTSIDARMQSRPQQLVFMTDGQPTVGETNIEDILKNARQANEPSEVHAKGSVTARVFSFGVGYDVNTKLLDQLAEDNKGASDYVLPEEDIEAKVGALYSKIAFPVLSDARLDWGGANVYDVYPRQIPDVFKGSQVVVFGRFKNKSSTRVQLIGTANGREERVAENVQWTNDNTTTLAALWAMRKVGFLLDDARRRDAHFGEVRDEVWRFPKNTAS